MEERAGKLMVVVPRDQHDPATDDVRELREQRPRLGDCPGGRPIAKLDRVSEEDHLVNALERVEEPLPHDRATKQSSLLHVPRCRSDMTTVNSSRSFAAAAGRNRNLHEDRVLRCDEMVRRRRDLRRLLLVALFLLMASLVTAPTGWAAKRKVPVGFFGVNVDQGFPTASWPSQQGQARLMARSGVESVRIQFNWSAAQQYASLAEVPPTNRSLFVPGPNGRPITYAFTDASVRLAAEAGMRVLPIVVFSPRWASGQPTAHFYKSYMPSDPQTYAAYLQALIARYGRNGSFWAENPTLPKMAIREWQIWNEPTRLGDQERQPAERYYPPLLKSAYTAIKGTDPGAKVVLAGIHNVSWQTLARLYKAGIKRYFDVAAFHPYTKKVSNVVRIVQLNRAVMRRRGDGGKPIYLTEVTYTAAKGRIPRSQEFGPETSQRGQAKLLPKVYQALIEQRRTLGIARGYWYSWATPYQGVSTFSYAGLVKQQGSLFSPQPALSAYARTASRYEGCRKADDARRCR